jgi:hypothetical protein
MFELDSGGRFVLQLQLETDLETFVNEAYDLLPSRTRAFKKYFGYFRFRNHNSRRELFVEQSRRGC